jgi:alkanesulfonate monooxygenase SsuD/methylene tetrahydromethanopterin reductase-like flavin-dependent oxidoreductase (luciferase family)
MSKFQPGQIPPEMAPAAWRGGASKRPTDLSVPALIAQGQMFAGNPDTVVKQIKEFRRRVGGVGRIIMMTRQGLMTHEEAMKSFTLTAREVLPQLQDLESLDEAAPVAAGAGA